MPILTGPQIKSLVETKKLIAPFNESSLQGASYDARLGPEFKKGGRVGQLSQASPSLSLFPGEFALLRSLEELEFPINLVGHNGIMSRWTRLGLVSLFSPQIDPGFAGYLMVPVFNAGDAEIVLNFGDDMFTLEFIKLTTSAPFSWAERNGRRTSLAQLSGSPLQSKPNFHDVIAIQEKMAEISNSTKRAVDTVERLQERIDGFEKRLNEQAQYRGVIAGLFIAVIALMATIVALAWALVPVMSSILSSQSGTIHL